MPTNPSERYLSDLASRSFLKLWSYPNPHRAAGKEIADLLVVFGDDLVIFSDKASVLGTQGTGTAWRRWYDRTIAGSVKQLQGASRCLRDPDSNVFVDSSARAPFPFSLPSTAKRRIHVVAVAQPTHDPKDAKVAWPGLSINTEVADGSVPFQVGMLTADGEFVHVFDGPSLELVLQEMDTVADFLGYLLRRKTALTSSQRVGCSERDLLALAVSQRHSNGWPEIALPPPDAQGRVTIPLNTWTEYESSRRAAHNRHENARSYAIDQLIEHFHEEYVAGRMLHADGIDFGSHEAALRILASESRFGRRIIANELHDILSEKETHTFWATTVASRDFPEVRYVWMTYPKPPAGVPLDVVETAYLEHLKEHVFVARALFPCDTIVGIAVPNAAAEILSHFVVVFDGTKWDDEAQQGALQLRKERGVFASLEPITRAHFQ